MKLSVYLLDNNIEILGPIAFLVFCSVPQCDQVLVDFIICHLRRLGFENLHDGVLMETDRMVLDIDVASYTVTTMSLVSVRGLQPCVKYVLRVLMTVCDWPQPGTPPRALHQRVLGGVAFSNSGLACVLL